MTGRTHVSAGHDEPVAASPTTTAAVTPRSGRELSDEARNLLRIARSLLRSSMCLSGEALIRARATLRDRLDAGGERALALAASARRGALHTAIAADRGVRDRPWRAIGVAAGIGLAVGVWIAGHRSRRR